MGPSWLAWLLAALCFLGGLAGVWLPLLPGLALLALGALIHKLMLPDRLSWWTVGAFGAAALGELLIDLAATAWSARRAGATRWGLRGAVFGALAGLFFGFPGLLLGPFLGAALAELLLARRTPDEALRSGAGTLLAHLAGGLAKTALALALLGLFLLDCFVF